MAKVPVLNDVQSLANTTSARAVLNQNFDRIEEAFENTLSRDGSTPNQMESDIDLNSHDLLNVGSIDAGRYLLNGVPIEQAVAYSNKQYELLSGNGTEDEFPLNSNPGSLGNLEVSIEGVLQRPGLDFYYNGTTLVFSTPPPEGDENIMVRYDEALPAAVADASALLYTPPSTGTPGSVRTFLDSLWESSVSAGAALLRFLQTGVGALARSIHDELSDHLKAVQFGVVADGVTDDSAAMQLAINEAIRRGKEVLLLPAGDIRIASASLTVALTGQEGVVIKGKGADITSIVVDTASGNGITFSSPNENWWLDLDPHNTVGLQDLTIVATDTNLGTGVMFDMGSLEGRPAPGVVLEDIIVRGQSSFFHYFAKAFDFLDTTGIRARNVRVIQGGPGIANGVAFDIRASGPATDPTSIKFSDCEAVFGQYGWRIGDHVEGVYLTQCDGVNVVSKVYAHNTTGESGLHVIGGHANTSGIAYDLDGMFDCVIEGPLIYASGPSASWRGIKSINGGSNNFSGAVIRGNNVAGTMGIEIDSTPDAAIHSYQIGDNVISSVETGVYLGVGARRVNVGDNQYTSVTNRVVNASGTALNNTVHGRTYARSIVVTMVGGLAEETHDLTLDSGYFITKPSAVHVHSPDQRLIGFYDWSSAFSTANSIRVYLRKADGTNTTAGAVRLSLIAME